MALIYITVTLSNNSDFMCFQKIPRDFVSKTMSGDFFVEFRSVVRGYHVYRSVWTPVLGELLYTE